MADVNDYLSDPISEQYSRVRSMLGPSTTGALPGAEKSKTGSHAGTGAAIGAVAGGPLGAGLGALIGKLFPKNTPANPTVGSLAPEPVQGDSLTQYLRSMTNYAGTSGERLMNQGNEMLGYGTDILQGGLNLFGQPVEYWQKLLSGDTAATTAALAPEADVINRQYNAAQRSAQANTARGGYRDVTLAEMPYTRAAAIGNEALKLRPTAATKLTDIAKGVSELGISEQATAQKQIALGEQQIATALQSLLSRRGQNAQVDMNNIQALVAGLTQVFRSLV